MNGNTNRPRTTVYTCGSCGQKTNNDGDGVCSTTGGRHQVDIAFHHEHAHTSKDPFGRDPDCHLCISEVAFRPDVQRVRLYGWVKNWPDAESPVRALLFGQLVKRTDLVQNYLSDLYHDAMWIAEKVHGPIGFYWMARLNGTNIGNSAVIQEQITTREPRSLYWVALSEVRGEWTVTFTELVRVREEPADSLTTGWDSSSVGQVRRR